MEEQDKKTLIALYLTKGGETLADAILCIENRRWNSAANRLYYAVFHTLNALLVSDDKPACSHKGMKLVFGKNYVLTGLASEEEAHLLSRMETMRNKADYDCTFTAKEEVVLELYPKVRDFVEHMESLVNRQR